MSKVHIERGLGWRHRLGVSVPMAALGFVQPSLALAYGFWALGRGDARG